MGRARQVIGQGQFAATVWCVGVGTDLDAGLRREVATQTGGHTVCIGAAVGSAPLLGGGVEVLGDGFPGEDAQRFGVGAGLCVFDQMQDVLALVQHHDGVGGAVVLVEAAVLFGVFHHAAQTASSVVGQARLGQQLTGGQRHPRP
ncbi:MAG: hypothetical protein R2873_14675 [Caldilineaceae bacterium]